LPRARRIAVHALLIALVIGLAGPRETDEDIINGIREGWMYKPQQVPVCFLYNIPIVIQQ
jgi:hypothetical protein